MSRLAALVLGLTLLAACNGQASPDGQSGAAPSPSPPATPGQPTEEPAAASGVDVPLELDFALPALDGGQVVGAELAGQAVALWFWTPW